MEGVGTYIYNHYTLCSAPIFEVEVDFDTLDRDSLKANVAVLTPAASYLGLRTGVRTCTVHVQALYDLMQVPVPRSLSDRIMWS